MDCEKARQLLHHYLDNALSNGEREEFQSHVFVCSGCRADLLRLERVLLVVEDLGVVEAPKGFTDLAMDQVRREARSQRHVASVFYISSLLTLILGIVLIVDSSISFVQKLSNSDAFGEGLAEGGYAFVDGFFIALSYMETSLLIGLCLAFISSTIFLIRLIGRLPNQNIPASRTLQLS